jgi:hypothetical protein
MNHEEALKIQAPEKYLLGEFSELERDQFEEHFFDCQACAAEVQAGAVFEANARAVFADQARRRAVPAPAPRPASSKVSWRDWLALRPALAGAWALSLLLLAGVSFQTLVYRARLAEINAPQTFEPRVLRADTRGDEQAVKPAANARFLGLALQLPPELDSPSYDCQVFNEAGSQVFALTSPAPAPGMPLYLLIPASQFHSGRYKLTVLESQQGSGKRDSATYGFLVQPE